MLNCDFVSCFFFNELRQQQTLINYDKLVEPYQSLPSFVQVVLGDSSFNLGM